MARSRRPSDQTIAVLAAFAADPLAWSHGYALCQRLRLPAGTIYPILMRLADRGLVEATWETTPSRGRPPRHLYRLTPAGLELVGELNQPDPAPVERVVPAARTVVARSVP